MKCTICDKEIGSGRYLINNYWGQTIHDYHEVSYCSSCGRFADAKILVLSDGRKICTLCQKSITVTEKEILWAEQQVRSFLAPVGFDGLPVQVPVKIVSTKELARLQGLSNSININQRGLTLTRYTTGLLQQSMKHEIYILDYLPKILFAGVLAHEMLHVWLNENQIQMPPPQTEGFCNMGSYLIYSSINHPLASFHKQQLQINADPIYGDGFRFIFDQFQKMGWQGLIKKVKARM